MFNASKTVSAWVTSSLWMLVVSTLLVLTDAMALEPSSGMARASHSKSTLLVLGDSLSAGYGIELKAAWPSLLQERLLNAGYPVQVVNASISGETTKGGLSRVNKLLASHHPKLVLIELGANDGLRGVPAKHARKNLLQTIHSVTKAGSKVLVFEMIIPPNYGQKFAMQYDDMYAEIGRMDQVGLIPFFLQDVIFEPGMMQADGLHPTASAQTVLLEHVWPYVEEKIRETNPMTKPQALPEATRTCREQDDLTGLLACDELGEPNEIL